YPSNLVTPQRPAPPPRHQTSSSFVDFPFLLFYRGPLFSHHAALCGYWPPFSGTSSFRPRLSLPVAVRFIGVRTSFPRALLARTRGGSLLWLCHYPPCLTMPAMYRRQSCTSGTIEGETTTHLVTQLLQRLFDFSAPFFLVNM